jgi:uncharacterized protein YprB with RNaseH-like and TPR domain
VIRSTFRIAPGVGPFLEASLWSAGIATWDDFPADPPPEGTCGPPPASGGGGTLAVLSTRTHARLRDAIAAARAALQGGDADALAAMIPRAERWRLYAAFAPDAAFLDVETDGDVLTAVGILDRHGPRVFLAGRDLDDFPAASRGWKMLVTFNGLTFDVPVLRRRFRGWRPPRAHVDLRPFWRRLGHRGGLKLLETEAGVGRPPHLAGLRGGDAVRLWRAYLAGDAAALRTFAEYNLHDAVNLRTLMDLGYNRMIERLRLPAAPVPVCERGDFRYDMTKALLAL